MSKIQIRIGSKDISQSATTKKKCCKDAPIPDQRTLQRISGLILQIRCVRRHHSHDHDGV
jgi:hypothetical protein